MILLRPKILAGLLALASVSAVSAQTAPVQPTTPYLAITREFLKPGQGTALIRQRASAYHKWGEVNWPRSTVALVSITSNEEVWYLRFFDTLGAIEQDRAQVHQNSALEAVLDALTEREGNLLADKRMLTALYFKDYTYRPDIDWSKMRYLDAISIHVRPGHHLEYLETRRIALAGHEKGGIDTHLPVFKVTSGEPGNTYLILRPLASLAGHDALRAQGFGEPLTDEEDKRMIALQAASVDREEEQFFRVEPKISSVTPAWTQADPDFWGGPALR